MLNLTHRSLHKEFLDETNIPYDDVKLNMQELNTINTLQGGHRITLQGFKQLLGQRTKLSVMEIGCGGGDNLKVIEAYCKKINIDVELLGIDINQGICQFAQQQNPQIKVLCGDYRLLTLQTKPDILFSSLFCHHFTDEELITQLQWMKNNARVGFFINDLHRNSMAYYSIKILTALFSNSYLVKNDAPLSVARGFKKREWDFLFKKAGFLPYVVQWKWAFRHLIVYKHGA